MLGLENFLKENDTMYFKEDISIFDFRTIIKEVVLF